MKSTIPRASAVMGQKVKWLSTGLPQLNKILGGGLPEGRIVEISGAWSVGKTTLALMMVAEAQREERECVWFDAEWAWEDDYAQKLGVNSDALGLIRSRDAETGLDDILMFVEDNKDALIVIDAVGALHPREESEKSTEGRTIGTQSALMARFCRKVIPKLALNNNTLIVLNHEYIPIMDTGGRPQLKTSGGAKLEYHKSVWIRLSKAGKYLKQGEERVGFVVNAEIRKNKVAPTQWQSCELQLIIGQGFSAAADLLLDAIESGKVTKQGNRYFLGEIKLGTGLNQARKKLEEDKNLADKLI